MEVDFLGCCSVSPQLLCPQDYLKEAVVTWPNQESMPSASSLSKGTAWLAPEATGAPPLLPAPSWGPWATAWSCSISSKPSRGPWECEWACIHPFPPRFTRNSSYFVKRVALISMFEYIPHLQVPLRTPSNTPFCPSSSSRAGNDSSAGQRDAFLPVVLTPPI